MSCTCKVVVLRNKSIAFLTSSLPSLSSLLKLPNSGFLRAPEARVSGALVIYPSEKFKSVCPSPRPSAPQGNQCEGSHAFYLLSDSAILYCTWVLWSIVSCQNRVSADQYHRTGYGLLHRNVSWAQMSTHRGYGSFLKLSADNLLAFNRSPSNGLLLSTDRRLDSKRIFLRWFQVYCLK